MVPVEQAFTLIVDEIGNLVTWLTSWQLFGIPFLYYFIGIVIMNILFDRIF